MEIINNYKFGWLRDLPDYRDFTLETKDIKTKLKFKKTDLTSRKYKRSYVDLRRWCSPVEDQGELGSCTANAAVGLIEYFEKRRHGRFINASRLFLYKVTRNLMKIKGDVGASIRSTMGAMVLFGIPPEEYWPYDPKIIDLEPPAFCYSFANNYKTIRYFRLDPTGSDPKRTLQIIKYLLTRGIPSMFGFAVFQSIEESAETGKIIFPRRNERVLGGHAVMAVGYDDNMIIGDSKGAILIRNSWGTSWGENGYGWLPYDYVLYGLAVDWWSLLKLNWVDLDQFKISVK